MVLNLNSSDWPSTAASAVGGANVNIHKSNSLPSVIESGLLMSPGFLYSIELSQVLFAITNRLLVRVTSWHSENKVMDIMHDAQEMLFSKMHVLQIMRRKEILIMML